MARSRNIKPGFFTNDRLVDCRPLARLLFAGLWTIADREGRLEDRPKKIKIELLPCDNCDVDDLLNELQDADFIMRYEVDNNPFIQILKFVEHQKPHPKEPPSKIPEPCKETASRVKSVTSNTLPSSSLLSSNPHPSNPQGACAAFHELQAVAPDDAAIAEAEKPKKEKRGERLEAYLAREGVDATSKAWGDWAVTEGMTPATVNDTMAQFRDWWRSAPGGKGVKADWPATWRGWVRRELSKIREKEKRDALFNQRRR